MDFSKAVEDFKKNGVAILPLKMEEEYIGKSRCQCAQVARLRTGAPV